MPRRPFWPAPPLPPRLHRLPAGRARPGQRWQEGARSPYIAAKARLPCRLRDPCFRKMNGLGNDFVVLDARARALGLGPTRCAPSPTAKRASAATRSSRSSRRARPTCSCASGTPMAARSAPAATRRAAWRRWSPPSAARRRSASRPRAAVLGATVNGDGSVTIDMGAPRFAWDEIPLAEPFHDTRRHRAADRARSTLRCCIRRRWSMSATRIASSSSMTSRRTISPGSGRCSSIIRSFPSAPISRWSRCSAPRRSRCAPGSAAPG